MSELKIVSDKKVDHPRKGSKDLSDAVVGAVYNAISLTPRNTSQTIEIHDWKSNTSRHKREQELTDAIAPPPMTEEAKEYLSSFGLI